MLSVLILIFQSQLSLDHNNYGIIDQDMTFDMHQDLHACFEDFRANYANAMSVTQH